MKAELQAIERRVKPGAGKVTFIAKFGGDG
jgi:hypothetical protein